MPSPTLHPPVVKPGLRIATGYFQELRLPGDVFLLQRVPPRSGRLCSGTSVGLHLSSSQSGLPLPQTG